MSKLSTWGTLRQIAVTDFRFRFRRTTALITLLGIAGGVYLIIPDIRTGKTLMEIGNQRVFYNSAAVALGTGMFCSILLTLFGYYFVSNSFRRDILSRTGYIIAATPVKNIEYISGKFIGAVAYLTTVLIACMLSTMVMFLIRGEAPLEPMVFVTTFAWLALPGIFFCAGFAILFESIKALSGRFGDVLYFLIWAFMLSVPAIIIDSNGGEAHIQDAPSWLAAVDISGLALVIKDISTQFHTSSLSIGQSSFDPTKPAIVFTGFQWNSSFVLARCSMFILPTLMALAGSLTFHRFNPTKIKMSVRHSRKNVFAWVNSLLKPVTQMLHPFAAAGKPGTIFSAVKADIVASLVLSPISVVALVLLGIISLAVDSATMQHGLIPLAVVAIIMTLADSATRDRSSGMLNLLYTTPRTKSIYIFWKLASAIFIGLLFTIVPVIRLIFIDPASSLSLLIGVVLLGSSAVCLGVLSRTPKTYMAVYLMLLYIALNSKTDAEFDFAGFNGTATTIVRLAYLGIAIALLVFAQGWYRYKLRST